MNAKSDMTLLRYTIKKMYYEMNDEFDFTNGKSIRINPDFSRNIEKVDKDKYVIKLNVKICESNQEDVIPFFSEICIEGEFHFVDWETEEKSFIARNNSTAILFPYLRSLLSTITTTGNLPPYFLPIMNVAKLFNEE